MDVTRLRRARGALVPMVVVALAPVSLVAPAQAASEPTVAVRQTENRTSFRAVGPTTPPPTVSLATWAVADLDTGKVLAVHRANARRQPASTLKLLTSLTAVQRVPAVPSHRVTWAEAHPEFCICVGLRVGRRYSRAALMAAMLLPSANDAAEAMAGSDRRSRRAFLRGMNRQAEQLGMRRTRAVNPSGLTAHGQTTTARDLLVLLRAAQADATVAPYLGRRVARFGPLHHETRRIERSNPYVDRYPAAEGKTGFTSAAGYNLVVSQPVRDDEGTVRRIGVAALGAPSREANTRSVAGLARWVADHYATLRPLGALPAAPGPVVGNQTRWVSNP